MDFLNETGCVNLIIHNNKSAQIQALPIGGDLNRGQKIGTPIGAWNGAVSHGAGDHDRDVGLHELVESERRFFDRIRALNDHGARRLQIVDGLR